MGGLSRLSRVSAGSKHLPVAACPATGVDEARSNERKPGMVSSGECIWIGNTFGVGQSHNKCFILICDGAIYCLNLKLKRAKNLSHSKYAAVGNKPVQRSEQSPPQAGGSQVWISTFSLCLRGFSVIPPTSQRPTHKLPEVYPILCHVTARLGRSHLCDLERETENRWMDG